MQLCNRVDKRGAGSLYLHLPASIFLGICVVGFHSCSRYSCEQTTWLVLGRLPFAEVSAAFGATGQDWRFEGGDSLPSTLCALLCLLYNTDLSLPSFLGTRFQSPYLIHILFSLTPILHFSSPFDRSAHEHLQSQQLTHDKHGIFTFSALRLRHSYSRLDRFS